MSDVKKYIGFKLNPNIDKLLLKTANTLGMNRSEYLRHLIQKDLEKHGLLEDEINRKLKKEDCDVE